MVVNKKNIEKLNQKLGKPEGKGTHRSEGSDKRIKYICGKAS